MKKTLALLALLLAAAFLFAACSDDAADNTPANDDPIVDDGGNDDGGDPADEPADDGGNEPAIDYARVEISGDDIQDVFEDNGFVWRGNTVDDWSNNLEMETLIAGKFLVFELTDVPEDMSYNLIWQGDANWGWNQKEYESYADHLDGSTLSIPMYEFEEFYGQFAENTRGKIYIVFPGIEHVDELGITDIYLKVLA